MTNSTLDGFFTLYNDSKLLEEAFIKEYADIQKEEFI